MIVGNGDVATMLKGQDLDHEDFVFFASGVSNSQCTDEAQFQRERAVLRQQSARKHLVYFSSLSVYYSTSAYAKHKFAMEEMVQTLFPQYSIVRLGNITWGNNPNTLLSKLRNGGCKIQDTIRYMVGPGQFEYLVRKVVSTRPTEINARGERLTAQQIQDKVTQGEL